MEKEKLSSLSPFGTMKSCPPPNCVRIIDALRLFAAARNASLRWPNLLLTLPWTDGMFATSKNAGASRSASEGSETKWVNEWVIRKLKLAHGKTHPSAIKLFWGDRVLNFRPKNRLPVKHLIKYSIDGDDVLLCFCWFGGQC
jgi:hypothetical protein